MTDLPHAPGWTAHLDQAQAAPRCGAKRRDGLSCTSPAMKNGRCRMHGGKSTGPRTPEGLERARRSRWKHGYYSAESKAARRGARQSIRLLRRLLALGLCVGPCAEWRVRRAGKPRNDLYDRLRRWTDASHDDARALAKKFVQRFPRVAAECEG